MIRISLLARLCSAARGIWMRSEHRPGGSVGCWPATWPSDTLGSPLQTTNQSNSPATGNKMVYVYMSRILFYNYKNYSFSQYTEIMETIFLYHLQTTATVNTGFGILKLQFA